MKNNNIEITTIDIETHPAKVLIYGNTWDAIVVKILEFESILSMAYKKGNGKTKYIALNKIKGYKKGDKDDKKLMIEISKILSNVECVVGHNSDQFDIKKIKERIMFHKLPPLPEMIQLDTKKLFKKVSRLPNNKLNTHGQFLNNGQKTEHAGVELFIKCGEGDEKSWRINEKYNKQDVDMTYLNLVDVLPYVKLPSVFNKMDGIHLNCSNVTCSSKNLTRDKIRKVSNGWRIQYVCKKCGGYTTDTNTLYKEKPIIKL